MKATKTHQTCSWKGASGTGYKFFIYTLPATFDPNQDGNYIYAKKNTAGQWVPIYIGEGDLSERSGAGHHKVLCIRQEGATHFHCHLNPDERKRLAEEVDLLACYTNAYAPHGCNERPGG